MFNQLYNTAKRILSRSPSYQDRSSELLDTPPTSHHLEVSMVTTRRGTETPGQDSSATPQSTGKRKVLKREIEALETPTSAKRQKRTTPKKKVVEEIQSAQDEENAPETSEDTTDTIAVIAGSRTEDITQEGNLPIRRRSSPQVVVDKLSPPSAGIEDTEEAIAEDAATPTQPAKDKDTEQKTASVITTPTTKSKTRDSPTPRAKRASGRKKQSHSEVKEAAAEIPSSSYESEQVVPEEDVSAQPKKAHVRFGSEEPEETLENTNSTLQDHKTYGAHTISQTTQPEIADSDDDASDSDEAPEVVTTSAAASKAAATQKDAARAQLAQQEKERQKREAREQRIATEQAEKRKREEKKAKKLAKQLAKQHEADDDDDGAVEPSIEPATSLSKSISLSGLLPTSLLSAIPDQRAPTPPQARLGKSDEELRREKLNRHIKFLERSEKGVKDLKKGKVSVAVLGKQNKVLPPKANRTTRDVRETWLKGRQGDKRKGKNGIGGKMERRGFGQRGFLRGDD
ncbi:U3 snoRNA associated-domain-containing protein [Phaeosphaeria sp. MPI-PUGE-AT-0046c]|nr:U3 snoRNA associated-domain-containing protein [Phaeosphaeria sp. MPI-PUGE-AT-0046c]